MIKADAYAKRMGLFDLHIDLLRQSLKHFSKDKKAVETFVSLQEQECSKGVDAVLALAKERERDFVDEIFVKAQGNKLRREIQHHIEFADSKIHQASELRNKIVHRESARVVEIDELKSARQFFTFVPNCCCGQAVKLYPTQFSEN